MIIAHYTHRLPDDYDVEVIRTRARTRGPLWDATPDLYFKGFLLREKGHHGAIATSYSSLYLWRQDAAFRDFLTDGRYAVVTEAFGRAEIQTWFALDAARGGRGDARFAYVQEQAIPLDASLPEFFAEEIVRNRALAEQPGAAVAVTGVNPQNWTLTRILLTEFALAADTEAGTAYQILHLAQPLLDTLPRSDIRRG